ncbi:MAG: flagellar biosynthesis protein FlgH [Cognatishimia activa]
MKKLLIILLGPLLLGPTGYFLGQMMAPEAAPPPAEMADQEMQMKKEEAGKVAAAPKEILYKMPLGKFTVQVMQPESVLHIVIDMDVYLAGASEFERLNGAEGRARLRDGAIGVLSDMAETTLWVDPGEENNLDRLKMIEEIVRKMHRDFDAIRTARINEFSTARTNRM